MMFGKKLRDDKDYLIKHVDSLLKKNLEYIRNNQVLSKKIREAEDTLAIQAKELECWKEHTKYLKSYMLRGWLKPTPETYHESDNEADKTQPVNVNKKDIS